LSGGERGVVEHVGDILITRAVTLLLEEPSQ